MKTKPEMASFLRTNIGVFAGFTDERLHELVAGSRIASFEADEAIVHCGAEAAHFGVVLNGALAASVPAFAGMTRPAQAASDLSS